MTRSTPIPREVAISAVNWQLAIHNGEASEISLNHWLDADPNHRRAWEHIQQVNKRLGLMTNPALRSALLTPQGRQRRKAVKQLSTLLFIGAAGVGAGSTLPWREQLADLRTASGERRQLTQPGNIRLDINSASALNLSTQSSGPCIELLQGDLLLDCERSAPGIQVQLETRHGRLSAQQARISLAVQENAALVDLFTGTAQLASGYAPGQIQRLEAGQAASFSSNKAITLAPSDPNRVAWTDGMLVAARMPLGEFVQQLARHRPGYLGCDQSVSSLPVSGSYPLADTDRILDALSKHLPIRIRRLSRYWVRVLPA